MSRGPDSILPCVRCGGLPYVTSRSRWANFIEVSFHCAECDREISAAVNTTVFDHDHTMIYKAYWAAHARWQALNQPSTLTTPPHG